MPLPTKTLAYLKRAKIGHDVVEHRKVFTAYDLAQTTKIKLEEIAKTLLIRADSALYLVLLRASDRLNLVKLSRTLKAKKVTIAKESDMVKTMKVKPGALTPFGTLHQLPVVMEQKLATVRTALFGSGSFEHSVRMKLRDFLKLEHPVIGTFGEASGLRLQGMTKPAKKTKKKR